MRLSLGQRQGVKIIQLSKKLILIEAGETIDIIDTVVLSISKAVYVVVVNKIVVPIWEDSII